MPDASRRVIVVLGYHETDADGAHGISATCRAGVRRAEALAAEAEAPAVIFTGWSSNGGPSEGEQMAAAWEGPRDIPLIVEPRATNTAENAVRSLTLLPPPEQVSEVVVVCSIRHFPRARFLFARLYRRHGYDVRFRYVARPLPTMALVGHELSSLTRMLGDRRRAAGLLPDAGRSAAFREPLAEAVEQTG